MIEKLIKKLFKKRDKIKEKFHRVLPMNEYLSDRWEKAAYLGFGEGTNIYDSSLVFGNVKVGKNCWIGPFTILDGSGGELRIGDNCNISAGTHIYTHDTVDKVIYNLAVSKSPVNIGNNCYIGPNVTISKGVSIGNNVIIGANSFVNQDIPAFSKGFGTPFKQMKNELQQ